MNQDRSTPLPDIQTVSIAPHEGQYHLVIFQTDDTGDSPRSAPYLDAMVDSTVANAIDALADQRSRPTVKYMSDWLIVVYHFWACTEKREFVMNKLYEIADQVKAASEKPLGDWPFSPHLTGAESLYDIPGEEGG